MNNDNQNNQKQPFKVNISDDDFLDPSALDMLTPPPVTSNKKKFEVHIDDSKTDFVFEEQQPQYKGEIYFSDRRPTNTYVTQSENRKSKSSNAGKKKSFNSGLALFCVIVVICTGFLSAIAITTLNDILALNRSEEIVTINIPNDATTNEIIDLLYDNGLVKQKIFCKLFYKSFDLFKSLSGKSIKTPVYLSGVYYVQKNLGLEGYLTEFKEIQKTADTVTLVFPEGWSVYQMFDKLSQYGVCNKDRLLNALSGTDFQNSFISDIPDDGSRTFKLEGYLFPDTYEFYENSDANSVIRKFLEATEKVWTEEYEEQAKKLGRTRDEIMIIASIIQREAANNEQMYLISSVIHNRLNHSVSFPMLQCDSTANYIKNYVQPNVSSSEAAVFEQKYNTYNNAGLPPGPICNPGEDAIKAALYPKETDYYYFRHDKYGEIYMAKTKIEHDENGNKVLRANNK